MELGDLPVVDAVETDPVLRLEDREMDRIAFGLWQRGSLPEVPAAAPAELEEVAQHASCL